MSTATTSPISSPPKKRSACQLLPFSEDNNNEAIAATKDSNIVEGERPTPEMKESLFSPDRSRLDHDLESAHLGGRFTSEDPATKRPRLGSPVDGDYDSDEDCLSGNDGDNAALGENSSKKGEVVDSDCEMMSVESFNFDSSESETEEDQDDDKDQANINGTISRRFNANLVVESIERGQPVLDQVEGRDVVLVVGKTGTGKSTLIQAIAGRKFQKYEHMCSFNQKSEMITATKIVYEAVDPIPGFEIGHEKMSKTASIGCYDPFESFPSGSENHARGSKSQLLYVDSPGFEDTNGQEADIATSVMLSQVASRCRSLRFVIMISYVSLLEDRGGSMRSVLRLIRSFAKDFHEEKQSFMFLFTHSNEITGVPDSIEGAKTSLQNEIIQTMGGTTDEETKSVLEYIRKSLKKGWPFANVFLPLKTDASDLVSLIAKKIKPMKDPFLARNCGLTQSSRLTLSGALQNQLQELRRDLLSKIDIDPHRICEALKIFQYFDRYIHTEDVRVIVREADGLLQNYIKHQFEIIENEVKRGTYSEHDFSASNVASIKGALSRLQALMCQYPDQIDGEAIETQIKDELKKFERQLMLERGQSFSGMHHHLAKMLAWSDGFPECSRFYERVKNHLASLIQESIAACISMRNIQLLNLPREQLQVHIANLGVLNSVSQDAENLSAHELDADKASDVYEAAVKNIRSDFQKWRIDERFTLKLAFLDDQRLNTFATFSAIVESLNYLLAQFPLCPELKDEVENLRMQLANNATEIFQEMVSALDVNEIEQSPQVKTVLTRVRLAYELLSGIGDGIFRQMHVIHGELIGTIKSHLMRRQGELHQITNVVQQQGIKDGVKDATVMGGFQSVRWFDAFLPEDERFVENCYIRFDRVYNDRIDLVTSEARRFFEQIVDKQCDSEPATKALNGILVELKQISLFANVMQKEGLEMIEVEARNELLGLVNAFIEKNKKRVVDWRDVVCGTKRNLRSVEKRTERLECILRESSVLRQLDTECDVALDSLYACIVDTCGVFSKHVKNIMNASGQYELKWYFLQMSFTLGKYSRTAQNLPNIEELKKLARNAVASDAKLIEDRVSQSSEWDEIDNLLTQFEGAKTLDDFTSNEATSRLRPLLQLREKKQAEVDDLLEQLIRDEDFRGIREFLLPYGQSKDQVKKQKFKKWLGVISSTLSNTVGTMARNLEGDMTLNTCESAARELEKLKHAKDELKQYQADLSGGLDLAQEIASGKSQINAKMSALLSEFEAAYKSSDYERMGINTHFIEVYTTTSIRTYIQRNNLKRINSFRQRYNGALKKVPMVMGKFINSKFQESKNLFRILSTLKNANECCSPKLNALADLYAVTRKNLTKELNEAVQAMRDNVSNNGCYDDIVGIMSTLNSHLGQDLKDHVIDSDLTFNSAAQLNEWREEKRERDRDMEFDGRDANEKLKQWKKLMDDLDPSATFTLTRISRQWYSGTTYSEKCSEIGRKIADRFANGKKSLNDKNHSLLYECIQVLDLIDCHVGKHVDGAGDLSRKLKELAVESFLALCKRAQNALQSERKMQFEGMLDNYRGFLLNVPFVVENQECQKAFSLTNQLVHAALESDIKDITFMLEESTFDKLKQKIQNARKFGAFIADRYTLLKEEISLSKHTNGEDPWLEKIFNICHEHFSSGRSFGSLKYFAILELPPSANESDIKKVFKRLAKKYHPDKTGSNDSSELFRTVTEAKNKLLGVVSSRDEYERPFSALIKQIGTSLRKVVQSHLHEEHYEPVEKVLFRLNDLKSLKSLVTPSLDHHEITQDIHKLVKSHVQQVKTTVGSHWSSKNYSALNDTITDLKLMEEKFKSYDDIFPSSWDEGIVKQVEQEIESLGRRAREYLSSQNSIKLHTDEFRLCFLKMGHVLVELPLFKDLTKAIMCSVLETCLGSEWGYSFLFEFGLGLQRSNENGSDQDNHVAQILVAEFSHFKEVMTMVWNEETSQKPAEDTVHDIKGFLRIAGKKSDLPVDKDQLLQSFKKFDGEYKKLLGEYIVPEADLKALVYKTVALAEKLHPIDFTSWDDKVKKQIPCILAGVFTVFTVLKSGASYNRLESTADSGLDMGENLLMKPHNIQVLTLLTLFGCGSSSQTGLDSQLMQIRTGEGKSMILGAAAVVIALLGFRVRCVCYSEYLSGRDFNLFRDVFDIFSVTEFVKYSKITTLSEDNTAAKGDIRNLTKDLIRGKLELASVSKRNNVGIGHFPQDIVHHSDGRLRSGTSSFEEDVVHIDIRRASSEKSKKSPRRSKRNNKNGCTRAQNSSTISSATSATKSLLRNEILLVDEVDVFFGADFYGQTYNQVAQLREPEIADILNHIWIANKRNSKRQRLADIQSLPAYSQLLAKMSRFKFLIDAEISLMIDQVRKVDEEPYFLDRETDRIGYRVMDSISYEATYGYRTVFAYLQEAERGNLKHRDSTLDNALAMPVSCGQFSYAGITPARILGVSGTLSALGKYEYDVLSKYGVETFMHVPSVYGKSNFQFDKAGDGIRIDTSKSDYFHSITDQIKTLTKQKRSVIVFFRDDSRLKEFTKSSFYRTLGRHKKLLTEDMSTGDKEFVISKAATAGQITITTAIFGRGTDFFCKDETVQKNGGVYIIQAFLSEERSEEIQIQGRTARQGKKGSYQLILLDSDLEEKFGLAKGMKDNVAKERWYQELCTARDKFRKNCCDAIEENLADATQKDQATHLYFDSLLMKDEETATKAFKEIYTSFKKGSMPSSIELDLAFIVDTTGSMAPYAPTVVNTVTSMLKGTDSITEKLTTKFPEIEFQLRAGIMGYRDIDDDAQFTESVFKEQSHFTNNINNATRFVESITQGSSGGGDLAEDHLGAIDRCANWDSKYDWTSPIKFMLLLTDAPAHGMVPTGSKGMTNVDKYSILHPDGLTAKSVIDSLIKKEIDLFICSFNPNATAVTEEILSNLYMNHGDNTEQRQITSIPMVPAKSELVAAHHHRKTDVLGTHGQHIVFVLDMSGSMCNSWSGVVAAYNQYLARRIQSQNQSDLVSVVQFDASATISVSKVPIDQAPHNLSYSGGGTLFFPAARSAFELASDTPRTNVPVVVFMSDGGTHDASAAADTFAELNRNIRHSHGSDLELHVIAFGSQSSTSQLQQIASSSRNGKLHTSADTAELSSIFVEIAGSSNVTEMLEAEIGKRISEAVSDRLSLEYIA